MENSRVLVFGIDGATFDVIQPAIARGKLPNLSSLMENGCWGRMQSTTHPITPMAWTSFATGVNAAKHGIFDFSRRSGNQVILNSSLNRQSPAIWTLLSQAEQRSVVVNVPFTYPPEEINGVMIPGFDAPHVRRDIFHPESVYDEMLKRFGEYRLDWTFPVGQRLDIPGYLEHVRQTIEHRGETGLYLMEKYPWDFYMTMFSSPDHVQHIFWKEPGGDEIIERVYEQVDEQLGKFLAAVPDDVTVMIMSDHGFGPIESIVYLDNWLESEGYLTRRRKSLRRASVNRGKRFLKRMLPISVRKSLRAKLPGLKGRLEAAAHSASFDWQQTRAYSYGMYGNIYINLAGRDPHGIVAERDYDALCSEISARLFELRDPRSGGPVVDKVYRKEELYSGPLLDEAPDLVVVWRDYCYFTKSGIDQGREIFTNDLKVDSSEYPHTGTHRLDGVFIARGPNIHAGREVTARIIDLAPTILHVMRQPVPATMDGEVLQDLFVTPREDTTVETGGLLCGPGQMKKATQTDEDEEAAVRARLRSLGYLE